MDITIVPDDDAHAAQLAHDLLLAAGPDRVGEVRVRSDVAGGLGFVVPTDLAETAGQLAPVAPTAAVASAQVSPMDTDAVSGGGQPLIAPEPVVAPVPLPPEAAGVAATRPLVSTARSRRGRQPARG